MDLKSLVSKWAKYWPAWASAILLSLAFPPTNFNLLVFVALAPLFGFLRVATAKEARRAGYLFGFLFFSHQMFWLIPFVGGWTKSYALAAIPWILTALAAGVFYMLSSWMTWLAWQRKWPWIIPILWVSVEAWRAYLPALAFPWGITALPLWSFPYLGQTAAIGTIFLTSAWVVLANVLVSIFAFPPKGESFDKLPFGRVSVRMGLVFLLLMVGSSMRFAFRPETQKVTMVVGQPGVDMAFTPKEEQAPLLREAAQSILATSSAIGSKLTIFPEGFTGVSESLPPISPVGANPPVPVMFGGNRLDGDKTYQSAYAFDGEWHYADKTRLVIFGEYVPFRKSLSFLQGFNLPSGDLNPSETLTTMKIGDTKVGALICFEGVFPDLAERHSRNGAQVLAQMSIDDWYINTPAWSQLWMSSVWRSIESGLPLLRVGGKGMSLATDNRGSVVSMAPVGKTVAMRVDADVPAESDAFAYRFAFVWLFWAVGLGYSIYEFIQARKKSANS